MNLRIFTVWHNKLYDELYADVSESDLELFTMFGVNEDYEKKYTPNRYNILFEYDLPIYNPNLQKHGYCQTTCMWHVWKNKLYQCLDYIGFIQYDMKPSHNMIKDIRETVELYNRPVIFHEQTEHALQSSRWAKGLVQPYEGSALEHYNKFFNTSYTLQNVLHIPIPIVHTFVIPTETFVKMMEWIDSYITYLENMYPCYPSDKSQSELLERCHGLFLAFEIAKNNMTMQPLQIAHIWPLYHDKTKFVNYKTIV
jgi:hypothetical protein